MKTNCQHLNCNLKVFENKNKCIFHCEKDDWFSISEKNEKTWNKEKVDEFWEEIRIYISNRKKSYKWVYYFDNLIFPDIDISLLNGIPMNKDKKLYKDFYFWRKNDKLEFENLLEFYKCSFFTIRLEEITIDSISFRELKNIEKLHLNNMTLESFTFEEINHRCLIELKSLHITNYCSFRNIQVDHLSLSNTKFEKLNILNSDFYSASFFDIIINNGLFINSKIEDVWIATGIHITNKDTFSYKNMNVLKADREYFRLLKNHYFEKQDYIEANNMYQKEMDSHLLKTYNKLTKKCDNYFKNLSELIVVGFGKFSSNFGQCWTQPLFWIILISFCFIEYFNINDISNFLNPFNTKYEEIKEIKFFYWLTYKVIISLFLYQLIMSLKRKTKY